MIERSSSVSGCAWRSSARVRLPHSLLRFVALLFSCVGLAFVTMSLFVVL